MMGLGAISTIFVIGFLDYLTGPRFALLVFYLAPVCFGAWFAGKRTGLSLATVATLIWYLAQSMDPTHEFTGFVLVWNAFIGFGVMSVAATLSAKVAERLTIEAELRITQKDLESRVQERTRELAKANEILKAEVAERTEAQTKLRMLNETLEERVAERSAAAEHRARELSNSEAALRRQTAILKSILKNIGDGVMVADSQGRILLFNPAAEQLLKITGLQIGASVTQVIKTASANELPTPGWVGPVAEAVKGNTVDGLEIFVRDSSGNHAWLSATGRPMVDEKGNLEGGVVVFRDVTSHKLLEKQIIEISDREQCRLGQELHDGLCQHLVGTGFAAELLRETLQARHLAEASRATAISDMIHQAITQARQLARGLYPVRLELDGLASALEELAQRTRALHNIECHFTTEGSAIISDAVAGFNLYRIAQEAVNNAVKHGRCDSITVSLEAVEDEVTLTITDNGVGVPASGYSADGMGLHIMTYRAQLIGGTIDIRRGIAGGTVVTCSYRNENRAKQPDSNLNPG